MSIKRLFGLDFHVLATLLHRGWTIVAGALTLVLIPLFLAPVHQGFYYTFASLLGIQVLFELGFNQVILLVVSHEASKLHFKHDGSIDGDPAAQARLSAILALTNRWYAYAAVSFAVICSLVGYIFFMGSASGLDSSEWLSVWLTLVSICSLNLFLSPRLAIVEGLGKVGHVARLRLFQSLAGYACMWFALSFGANLWATIPIPLVAMLTTALWLARIRSWYRPMIAPSCDFSWRKEVLPLQWKIAVSWACGYVLFSLFTPIVFASHGPIEAGKLGIAMSVFNSIVSLGLSWVNAKVPSLTTHVARGESKALNELFLKVASRSTAATALLSTIVVVCVFVMRYFEIPGSQRIASPEVLVWMGLSAIINTICYGCAAYMRAHKEEPMLTVSVVSAVLTAIVMFNTGESILGMMAAATIVSALVTLPWTLLILRRYRIRHLDVNVNVGN